MQCTGSWPTARYFKWVSGSSQPTTQISNCTWGVNCNAPTSITYNNGVGTLNPYNGGYASPQYFSNTNSYQQIVVDFADAGGFVYDTNPTVVASDSFVSVGIVSTVSGSFSGAVGTGLVTEAWVNVDEGGDEPLNVGHCTYSPSVASGSCSGVWTARATGDYSYEVIVKTSGGQYVSDTGTLSAQIDPRNSPVLQVDTPDTGESFESGEAIYFHVKTSVPYPLDDSAPVDYGLAIEKWDGQQWIPATHTQGGVVSSGDIIYQDANGTQYYTGAPPYDCIGGSCPPWFIFPRYSYGEPPYNAFVSGLADGAWRMKARVRFNGFDWSSYSTYVAFGVGGTYDFVAGGYMSPTLDGQVTVADSSGGLNPTKTAPKWDGSWTKLPQWIFDYFLWLFVPDVNWIVADMRMQVQLVAQHDAGFGSTIISLTTWIDSVLAIQPSDVCPFPDVDLNGELPGIGAENVGICDEGGLGDMLGTAPQLQELLGFLLCVFIDAGLIWLLWP